MADDRHEDEGIDETCNDPSAKNHENPGEDALADEFATSFEGEEIESTPGMRSGPRFDDHDDEDASDDDDDDDDYDDDDDDDSGGYDDDEDEDGDDGWGGNTGLVDGIEEEASFACPSCGEEIVIPIDISEGSEQELTEDCPVCCNPNVITITIDDAGEITAEAESESD